MDKLNFKRILKEEGLHEILIEKLWDDKVLSWDEEEVRTRAISIKEDCKEDLKMLYSLYNIEDESRRSQQISD